MSAEERDEAERTNAARAREDARPVHPTLPGDPGEAERTNAARAEGAPPAEAAAEALKALLTRIRADGAAQAATGAATAEHTSAPPAPAEMPQSAEGAEDGRAAAAPIPPSDLMPPAGVVRDAQNRVLCGRRRRDGGACTQPAMKGQSVCKMHGGMAPQAKAAGRLRLAALVDPAIGTLAREMVKAERSSDRQRAANSILDRAGFGREKKLSPGEDVKDLLIGRLRQLRREREAAAANDAGELEVLDAEVVETEDAGND